MRNPLRPTSPFLATSLSMAAAAITSMLLTAGAAAAPTHGVESQGTRVDGVLFLHDVETLEYVRGAEFIEDWRWFIVLGETQLREVMDVLGKAAYDEFIDDEHWLVYEHEVTTISVAEAMEKLGQPVMIENVRGKRLRLKLGGDHFHVVVDWVYESWSPVSRTVETATYFHSKPLVSKTDTRESVIRDAETWLDAAGITTPEVRRSMFNNALEAEGMEPMAEGEGEGQ